jgi:hypothetical protein
MSAVIRNASRLSTGEVGVAERPLDAERVAALLDGRLAASERVAVLAQIAADPEWRSILADAAAVNEGTVEANRVPRASTRPTARPSGYRIAAIVMGLAAVVALTVRFGTGSERVAAGARDPVLAVLDDSLAPPLPDDVLSERWSTFRGNESSPSEVVSVRLGALSVDAAWLIATADARITQVRAELRGELATLAGSGPVAELVDRSLRVGGQPRDVLVALRAIADSDAFSAGAWLEQRRIRARVAPNQPLAQVDDAIGAAAAQRLLDRREGAAVAVTASADSLLRYLARD